MSQGEIKCGTRVQVLWEGRWVYGRVRYYFDEVGHCGAVTRRWVRVMIWPNFVSGANHGEDISIKILKSHQNEYIRMPIDRPHTRSTGGAGLIAGLGNRFKNNVTIRF